MKTGWLFRNGKNERWNIVYTVKPELDYSVLTSGCSVEVKVGNKWIRTRVEHNGEDYYVTTQGLALCNEMKARIPE